MSTSIKVQVQDSGSWLSSNEPDRWEFHVVRNTKKAAVVAALCAFVKQYDGELEEASRELFHVLDTFKNMMRSKADDQAEQERQEKEAPK